MTDDALRATVRDKYAAIARGDVASCCGSDADGSAIKMIGDAYDGLDGHMPDADLGLGCGLPVPLAGLAPGQTVLDLGAGAGVDAFVARRVVGETGRVVGVDMTPEMVKRARANAAALGYTNVDFLLGDIEALPLDDASVDVVVSNCVLNLVPDKPRAFAEMRRVLRPGGHFCVSDVVALGPLPAAVRASAELYAGCVAGAVERERYLGMLRAAGFDAVEVAAERRLAIPDAALPAMTDDERAAWDAGGLASMTVRGTVPGGKTTADTAAEAPATLRVYDPPQCCATGVCGPDPDPALARFAADLKAVEATGASVRRLNLAHEPEAFLSEPLVATTVNTIGTVALPLIVAGGRVVSVGRYPSRDELLSFAAGPTDDASADDAPAVPLDLASCSGPGCC